MLQVPVPSQNPTTSDKIIIVPSAFAGCSISLISVELQERPGGFQQENKSNWSLQKGDQSYYAIL
eukprot:scaffold2349_cov110-Cylindrotheca_fusiformis.AAC.5